MSCLSFSLLDILSTTYQSQSKFQSFFVSIIPCFLVFLELKEEEEDNEFRI